MVSEYFKKHEEDEAKIQFKLVKRRLVVEPTTCAAGRVTTITNSDKIFECRTETKSDRTELDKTDINTY